MPDRTLKGCRVLLVEDEYMLADELASELADAGATVLGPIGTLDGAIEAIGAETHIDAAILDVNLGGELVYPAADLLLRRDVPFVFTTGYDASALPSRFEHVACCEKPVDVRRVGQAVGRAIHE